MQFAEHSELAGSHAFLSASTYHWMRYSEEKLAEVFVNKMTAAKGTRLHEIARDLILEKIKVADIAITFNQYVNDAIGFRMIPEQILFYSYNAYGTADAIHFDEKKKLLRVHDLKNGITKASFDQLLVYCALFCLEYNYKATELEYILRIYQNDEVLELIPDVNDIVHIMDKIVTFDRLIEKLREEGI